MNKKTFDGYSSDEAEIHPTTGSSDSVKGWLKDDPETQQDEQQPIQETVQEISEEAPNLSPIPQEGQQDTNSDDGKTGIPLVIDDPIPVVKEEVKDDDVVMESDEGAVIEPSEVIQTEPTDSQPVEEHIEMIETIEPVLDEKKAPEWLIAGKTPGTAILANSDTIVKSDVMNTEGEIFIHENESEVDDNVGIDANNTLNKTSPDALIIQIPPAKDDGSHNSSVSVPEPLKDKVQDHEKPARKTHSNTFINLVAFGFIILNGIQIANASLYLYRNTISSCSYGFGFAIVTLCLVNLATFVVFMTTDLVKYRWMVCKGEKWDTVRSVLHQNKNLLLVAIMFVTFVTEVVVMTKDRVKC